MIILNSHKELIRVESWADITERPGFRGDLDPAKHTLASIIGQYAFGDKVPCGLSNCHTPHNKGYIVVTKDGRETNIGRDCGKTYFGVDFETLSNQFDRDIRAKESRERLWAFFFRSDEIASSVTALRTEDRGADWTNKELLAIQDSRNVTPKVARRLLTMSKARNPQITREREATEEEVARREQVLGRRLRDPQFVSEVLGELRGLEALYPENNVRALLIDDVSERLKELGRTNIDALNFEELRKWSKWLGGYENVMDRAAQAVQSARLLLTQSNLAPLADAAGLNSDEQRRFLTFLRRYPLS